MKYLSIHKEVVRLTNEMAVLQSENEDLKSEIHKLKTDKAYVEKVAREKYNFLKKNEMIFEFEQNK